MKKDNIVKDKSTDFAVRIINLVKHLTKNMPYTEHAICTELLTLEQYESVNNDCKELNKLLISIIKNLKNN